MSKIQDLQEFINLLNQGYTNEQLAAYYTCGITTVKRFKAENNLIGFKTNSKPLSDSKLEEIQALASKGKSLQQISQLLSITAFVIKKYVPETLYTEILLNSRSVFSANLIKADIRNIFIPNEHSAYICGVLQSDGFLTSDGYIGLTAKDLDFVKNFAKFFKTNVREYTKDSKTYYSCRFKDIRNLEKFKQVTNIYPNKTYSNYEIPTWIAANDTFMYHFIAGVFDGDGWVYKVKDTLEIGIEQHVNSRKFLERINEYLGWNVYGTDSTYRIHTKSKEAVKTFYEWYSRISYIMLRKVSVFDDIYL